MAVGPVIVTVTPGVGDTPWQVQPAGMRPTIPSSCASTLLALATNIASTANVRSARADRRQLVMAHLTGESRPWVTQSWTGREEEFPPRNFSGSRSEEASREAAALASRPGTRADWPTAEVVDEEDAVRRDRGPAGARRGDISRRRPPRAAS